MIDAAGPDAPPDNTYLEMATALRQLGWRVSFGVIGGLETEDPRASLLRGIGVQVLRAPFHPSLEAAIATAGRSLGLIQLSAAAVPALPPTRVRTLSPDALIVLCLLGPDVPHVEALREAVAASSGILVGDPSLADSLPIQEQKVRVLHDGMDPQDWFHCYRALLGAFQLPPAAPR